MQNHAWGLVVLLIGASCAQGREVPDGQRKLPPLPPSVAADADTPMSALLVLADNADLSARPLAAGRPVQFVYDTLRAAALAEQAPLVAWLDQRGFDYEQHYLLNAIAVTDLTMAELVEAASRPEVMRVQWDFPIGKFQAPAVFDPGPLEVTSPVGENIHATGADKVWAELGVNGQGIVVAGQDTGIDWDHPALKEHYRGYSSAGVSHDYNWFDAVKSGAGSVCGTSSKVPCDDYGHGTHTLGTMVGGEPFNKNRIGMAPGATWIGCRNMNNGVGSASRYLACFEFFLAPFPYGGNPLTDGDPSRAAHVINNSWTCDATENCTKGNEFVPVLDALESAGVFVVVSAGNAGSGCQTINAQPATLSEHSFAVGAIDHTTDKVAKFSSRGPSTFDGAVGPDVMAPGIGIRSAIPGGGYQGGWNGTSMAGPHVAGLVALMWSANPALIGQNQKTRELIQITARQKSATNGCGGPLAAPNNTYGHGIIDAFAATSAALAVP